MWVRAPPPPSLSSVLPTPGQAGRTQWVTGCRVPEPRVLVCPGNLNLLSLEAPDRLPLGWSTHTFTGGFLL